jgi:UDP-glucose 4-epimerase
MGDVRNTEMLKGILQKYRIDSVMHFAGLKAVEESISNPIAYYSNNVQGTISVIEAMEAAKIYSLVFSSSATVYGLPDYLPCDESHPTNPINPYGRNKLQAEFFLRDVANSNSDWRIACLRYFNPLGAHESGLIGDSPSVTPQNLMPYMVKVAAGVLPHLVIFGNDYQTRDGTGERDYIHIMDLAEGHLAALNFLTFSRGFNVMNLGTGKSVSVLECVEAFEKATGKKISIQIMSRRNGDIPICYANSNLAEKKMGWIAQRTIADMCLSAWKFQLNQLNLATDFIA